MYQPRSDGSKGKAAAQSVPMHIEPGHVMLAIQAVSQSAAQEQGQSCGGRRCRGEANELRTAQRLPPAGAAWRRASHAEPPAH